MFVTIFPSTFICFVTVGAVIYGLSRKHRENQSARKENQRFHDFCEYTTDFVHRNADNIDLLFWRQAVLSLSSRYNYHVYTIMNQIRSIEPNLSHTMNQLYPHL